MKASFSLSSLQSVSCTSPKDNGVKPRLYNSLTKNRVKATAVRRSWGSTASDQREEFWSALQANYNYIMDNQLIDKCQETNGHITLDTTNGTWSLNEFHAQFSELYSWLNKVQEIIYGKEENIVDKSLRTHCVEMVHEKSALFKEFNEQASHIVEQYPQVFEEIGWRVTHLNSKWDTILSILGPSECSRCEQEACIDVEHEIKCLRKWFKTMDAALQPLNFRTKYSKTELEKKALELKVLHRDIESHGKIVGSVVKLCQRTDASCTTANVRRIANGLEKRWHHLFLRSLEWQCYIESLVKKGDQKYTTSSSSESDSDCYEGPTNKYPRLYDQKSIDSICDSKFVPLENDSEEEERDVNPQLIKSSNVMNKNNLQPLPCNRKEKLDKLCLPEDTSHFRKSDRKAPNFGTYYFKHEDTESDMDRKEQNLDLTKIGKIQNMVDTVEETSEEEWSYSKNDVPSKEEPNVTPVDDVQMQNSFEDNFAKSKGISEDTKWLVQRAEELVSPDKCRKINKVSSLNKITKVKKWLSMDKTEDNCDASGEDDEKESTTSEDFDKSSATFRAARTCGSQNTSFSEFNHSAETPKIFMRQKKYIGNRPRSISCISQLGQQISPTLEHKKETNFSISESALHQMNLSAKNLERYDSSNNSITVNGNNSTSSTVEDTNVLLEEKTSPCRRRRLKLKKKSVAAHSLYCASITSKNRSVLFKSGSFSGCSNRNAFNERHISSDPPAVNLFCHGKYETSTTSGADTDEDKNKRLPFKLGLKTHYLSPESRDDSPGKSSLTTEEQMSSLSEQAAWDSYQEKYLSEAYSEAHDSDAARKLLEFGEDYRNFIDSQSDWSSTNPDFSPTFRRRTLVAFNNKTADSDSDAESIKKLFASSRNQLNDMQDLYRQQLALGLDRYLVSNGIEEMVSNCVQHIDLLNHLERSDELAISKAEKGTAAELLLKWEQLKANLMKMQEYRDLQKEILLLKNNLVTIEMPEWDIMIDVGSVVDLGKDVEYCEKTLEVLSAYKSHLLRLNISVHRFVVENKEYNASVLKSDVSDLYRLWEELHNNTSDRLAQLKPLLQGWEMLESRLEQLQGDLRNDEKTLMLLDSTLQSGPLSDETAVYVRDVAKLLSETTSTNQGSIIPELFTEGSLSDSGISDEGSEHELGERERRLGAIRRLVRQLEVVLSPNSMARVKMAEKLNAAEEELKELQRRCRSLIVRTAINTNSLKPSIGNECCKDGAQALQGGANGGDPDEPDGEWGSLGKSWFQRVVRASVPFQVVIITLLCLACLLEPQCCDNMNTFAMSFAPQLRYVKGPPPI